MGEKKIFNGSVISKVTTHLKIQRVFFYHEKHAHTHKHTMFDKLWMEF